MNDNTIILALICGLLALVLAIVGLLPINWSEIENPPDFSGYANKTDIPQSFPYGNLTDVPDFSGLSVVDLFKYRRVNAGRWYGGCFFSGGSLSYGMHSSNNIRAVPFIVVENITADAIAFKITSTAAGNARVGIYNDTGNVYPMALIVDSGNVDLSLVAGVKISSINVTFTAGLYWFVMVNSVTVTAVIFVNTYSFPILGFDSDFNVGANGWIVGFSYGSLPSAFPSGASPFTVNPPLVAVRLVE